jgi:stage V sporulation protein D (sporulation-specific penicillin-binding protein)
MPGIGLRRRVGWAFIIATSIVMALCLRLVWIQFVRGEDLRQRALNLRMRDVPVEAKRGVVYDRNGKELAVSINVDSVFAIPAQIKKPEETAQQLATALGLNYDDVLARLTKKEAFVWIKRKITGDQSKTIRQLALRGINTTQESSRFYPKKELACHVIGIAGIDSQGLEGLEVTYDKDLRGTPGKFVVEYDALGREIPDAIHQYIPPVDGNSIVTTLDESIQYIVERNLDEALLKTQAKGGTIIVMDPQTGEILGLANRPGYDPNTFASQPAANRRNSAIADTYPPGSTFKPITAAAALEEGVASLNDTFYCPGFVKIGGRTIHCWKAGGHGSQTFAQAVENSCNVAFVNLALRLGTEKFYHYLNVFNIGGKTGIDLPGEAVGIMPSLSRATQVDLACMGFGQTLTVTPVELVSAIAAIANGGVMMQPHLVKEIRAADGTPVKVIEPTVLRQTVSKQTANDVAAVMQKVVGEGTGKRAIVEGYHLAGKTCTAEKVVNGRIADGKYIASFAGFGPTDNPRVAILITLDEPQGQYFGGVIAAPVFSAVVRDIFTYLKIPPKVDPNATTPTQMVAVPDVLRLDPATARARIEAAGLKVRLEGSGPLVTSQTPPGGVMVARGTTVLLTMRNEASTSNPTVRVPNVVGLSLREAAQVLEASNLRCIVEGSGLAVSQDPVAGTEVQSGTVVTVTFK